MHDRENASEQEDPSKHALGGHGRHEGEGDGRDAAEQEHYAEDEIPDPMLRNLALDFGNRVLHPLPSIGDTCVDGWL